MAPIDLARPAPHHGPTGPTGPPTAGPAVAPVGSPADVAVVRRLTAATFDEAIASSPVPVLVDLTATWCPPCRQLTPVLAALAVEQADRLAVVEVDIDAEPALAVRHGVLSAPTMVLYVDGRPVQTLVGARSRARLLEDLDPHLPGAPS